MAAVAGVRRCAVDGASPSPVTQYEARARRCAAQIDQALRERAAPSRTHRAAGRRPGTGRAAPATATTARSAPPNPFGDAAGKVQFVSPRRRDQLGHEPRRRACPSSARTQALAAPAAAASSATPHVEGVHLRVLTVGRGERGAAQVARPLTEVDRALRQLLWILLAVGAGGIVVAALLGGVVARAALAPGLALHAPHRGADRQPRPLAAPGGSSGRTSSRASPAASTRTLDALEQSAEAQRHLVADASHELRTPIASLRANIQVLEDADRLPEDERAACAPTSSPSSTS